MKIGIVGAGWAGLAAASECLANNLEVTLFDASHAPGGRARAVHDSELGDLDNGQHLLIGAYRNTLSILNRDLGHQHIASSLKRLPLWLQSVDGRFRIRHRATQSSSTLANAMVLLAAKGLSLKDKWQISALLWRLRQSRTAKHQEKPNRLTVTQWLSEQQQTAQACRWLWHPLCLATMNTKPDQACAVLFQNVLRDSLISNEPGAIDLLLPTKTLSDLWPAHIAKRITTRWGHVVREIKPQANDVFIDGNRFDGCVLAVPPTSLARLIAPIAPFEGLLKGLSEFQFRSIATCYVTVDRHLPLPAPLLMFDHGELGPGIQAQWVFDRNAFMGLSPTAQLAFVISCADGLIKNNDLGLAHSLLAQLKRDWPTYTGKVLAARCYQEKRATFAALPDLVRPRCETPNPRIALAGDWTDTGYPAVIEGAVISGIKAAHHLARLRTDQTLTA